MISRKRNFDKRKTLVTVACMIVALALQCVYWEHTYTIKPDLGVVSQVPSDVEADALSFGDKELYFRSQALNLQFMGDTWGRSTPLKDYDYKLVYQWLVFLDKYDPKSNMLPSAAAYYYSKTQHPADVSYILDYLEKRSFADPEYNWWWLSQSIYLANSVLHDKQRAIRIASVLRKVKADIPIWARQMEAFLQEDLGDKDKAADIMCDAIKNSKNFAKLPQREIDFFVYFFNERLKMWKGKENELIQYCAEREMKANGIQAEEEVLEKKLPENADKAVWDSKPVASPTTPVAKTPLAAPAATPANTAKPAENKAPAAAK